MAGRHRNPALTTRPLAEDTAGAQDVLRAEQWSMQDFVSACLRMLCAERRQFLKRLAKYRPEPVRRGRPAWKRTSRTLSGDDRDASVRASASKVA